MFGCGAVTTCFKGIETRSPACILVMGYCISYQYYLSRTHEIQILDCYTKDYSVDKYIKYSENIHNTINHWLIDRTYIVNGFVQECFPRIRMLKVLKNSVNVRPHGWYLNTAIPAITRYCPDFSPSRLSRWHWRPILKQRHPCFRFAEYLVILRMLVSKPSEFDLSIVIIGF